AAASRRYLRVALREAEAENLIAVLLEDGEFIARLLPEFIAAPGPGNARLAHFAGRVLRLLKSLPTAPLNSRALAGVSRQEHRVLSYVADGYKNKQIGRALGLSESTVKFHLRSLFRKLKVTSRTALADAARSRGIST
ncbi:MAG TPA: LuxR C-terminal-related transcriptional regulator, partial [Steroidobacteraceae bacterium]|nr:LuxR C-terminal-related transcriptional regulator [Steroidobacteraceae bacterium]